jgi:hypothetical protein
MRIPSHLEQKIEAVLRQVMTEVTYSEHIQVLELDLENSEGTYSVADSPLPGSFHC